jgi:hypothetical protein
MRNKPFTPINIGAFDLQHRIVLEWPFVTDRLAATNQLVPTSDALLSGGLAIHDPGQLIWPDDRRRRLVSWTLFESDGAM